MTAQNTDAEYSGENVSRVSDYSGDEADWDASQFASSTDNVCSREGCESHTTEGGDLFCRFCWENQVLPETNMSAFTAQKDGLDEIDNFEEIGVEIERA